MANLERTARRPGKHAPSNVPPPDVVQELAKLEADLGGRTAMAGLLALAPLDQPLRYVLGMIGDPRNGGKSLAHICAAGNIYPGDLLKHLATAALLRGRAKAAQRIGDGIDAVTEDVMRRAAPYDAPCADCQGLGTLPPAEPVCADDNPAPRPCLACRGTGVLRYQPELDRQKLAVDLAQLLPKGGGLQIVNQNQQMTVGSGAGTIFERLQALTDKVLFGEPDGPDDEDAERSLPGTSTPIPDGIIDEPAADPPEG